MAIAIDPVCGMEVDTTTSLLSFEHDGKTYWFCGKGCLLEFKDDPEKYLDRGLRAIDVTGRRDKSQLSGHRDTAGRRSIDRALLGRGRPRGSGPARPAGGAHGRCARRSRSSPGRVLASWRSLIDIGPSLVRTARAGRRSGSGPPVTAGRGSRPSSAGSRGRPG